MHMLAPRAVGEDLPWLAGVVRDGHVVFRVVHQVLRGAIVRRHNVAGVPLAIAGPVNAHGGANVRQRRQWGGRLCRLLRLRARALS